MTVFHRLVTIRVRLNSERRRNGCSREKARTCQNRGTSLEPDTPRRPPNQWLAHFARMIEPKPERRIDRIYGRIESHGFESLTLSERASFGLTWLYMETNNGGLHQFFFNDAGKLAPDALRGLEMVGAPETASILRRAMSVFPDGVVPLDQEQRREFLCDALTPVQEQVLRDLTTEFLQSSEPVAELLDAYVQKHPEEFPT